MVVTGNSAPIDRSPPPSLSVGLAELFTAQVHRTPNAPALLENGHSWSYQALYEEAVALAGALRRKGVHPETAVGLFMERSAPIVIATLAVVLAGGIYVPLDPGYPTERLAVMCREAKVALVVTSADLRSRTTFSTVPVRTLTDFPVSETDIPLPTTDPRQAAYIMFTSGSTGQPKGITVLHSGVARLVLDTNYVHIAPGDHVAHASNPAFDAATFEIWGALLNGGTLVILSRDTVLNPIALATAIRDHSLDFLLLTTALFNQMVYHDPTLFSTLHYALFGGEAADPHAVRLLLANNPPPYVVNGYGPTECTTFALTYTTTEVQNEATSLPIGTPINHTTAFIVGEDGSLVPDGVIGELYLGGVGLARGYSHRSALTAERFVPDAFSGVAGARLYRTGDLVRRINGVVEYFGRNDTQVKIRGYRIELGEIEVALQQHSAVRQAAVLAQIITRDGSADKRLVAFIVPRDGDTPFDNAEVQSYLAARLPAYMVPRLYIPLAQLPVTPNGKLDRRILEHLAPTFHEGEAPVQSSDEKGDLLPALAALWERLLGMSNVQPTDNFILLGGHSLLITRLAAQIRTRFGVEVGLSDLFGTETLAALAALMEERRTTADPLALPPLTRGEISHEYPLSFPQERIWFLSQLVPDNLAYNFQMSVRWQGNLRPDLLQKAFTEIIRRHEVLRSTFHGDDGIPVMRVQAPFVPTLPMVDMTHVPEAERESAIAEIVRSGVQVVFDVTRLPLVKWVLYRFAPDDHVLLQVEHHFVHDGWSLSVLLKELKTLYTAYSQGQPSPLPELQTQFGDFTRWQREVVSGERYERLRAYWGNQLADYPPAPELPHDHPRPAQQTMRGDVVRRDLPMSLYRRLKGVAQQEGATFYMLLMAAFKSMLYRYTSQADLVVATGVANRRAPEAEALIGMVVNTLILRTQVEGDEPFTALLRRVKRTTVEAYAHQDMPFERVVEVLQPTRDLSHIPLYQVMFSFHDSAVPALNLPDVTGRLTEQHNRTAKCDLNIIVIPRPEQQVGADETAGDERVTLWWEYSTEVFEKSTIEDLLNHYLELLEAIADAPTTPIARLPLQLPSDDAIYDRINDTQSVYPKDTLLATLFEAQVAKTPHAIAVVDGDNAITYDDLNRRANRLAHALQAEGVIEGDTVGLCLERSVDNIVALLAVVKRGATYLPFDPTYPADRLAWIVEDSQPRGILSHAGVPTTPIHNTPIWQMDDPAFTVAMPDHNLSTVMGVEPIAYIMYTSGSTGTPKGILIPHRAVVRLVVNTNYVNIMPEDGIAHLSNTAFDAGTFEIWGALLNGARMVVIAKETALSPARLTEQIAMQGVTVMFMTTALFNQIVTYDPHAFSGLRTLYFGGEAADANAVRSVLAHEPPATFGNIYGPTEGTTFSTYYPITTLPKGARTVPIGVPVANTQLNVVDAHNNRVPVGALGELVLYGDGVAHGYLNRLELTTQKFGITADGERYYRTGDVVRLRRDGALDFIGRRDGQIKLRGFRIEVGEIEHALRSHPTITATTVMIHGEGEARQLVAYWVGNDDLSATELRAYLRQRLPEYMLPAFYTRLETLPVTPNGKIDRRALPAPTLSAETAESLQPAVTESEKRLVTIWQSVLGQEVIGANSHFFEMGGHSLLATRVVARVREQWGLDIPLALLFQHPVLAEFAAALDRSTTTSVTPMPELRAESDGGLNDADLQAQLDALSPDELAALLAEMESLAMGSTTPLDAATRAKLAQLLKAKQTPKQYPIGYGQQRLWFLDQLEPNNIFYNTFRPYRLGGALDIPALEKALNGVLERHAALRTTFMVEEGQPVQVVAPALHLPLTVTDLQLPSSATERESRGGEVREVAVAHAERAATIPFDLSKGPLVRWELLRLAPDEHWLLLTFHHIVVDGWSLGLFAHELNTLYSAFREGVTAMVDPLPIQYSDFTRWQQEWLTQSGTLERELAYWQHQLRDVAPLELPTDRPRPSVQRFEGAVHRFALPDDLTNDLRALSRREGVTLFMTLLAGWYALLYRHTGQGDITVGSPVAGRPRTETEALIGLFINTVVLRATLADNPTVRALLQQVRYTALEAFHHQDVPFEQVVNAVTPTRALNRSPLFDVMFALQNSPAIPVALDGVEVSPVAVARTIAAYDLTLALTDDGIHLEGLMEFNTHLFEPETIATWTERFIILLRGMVAEPTARLNELPILTPTDRRLIHTAAHGTTVPLPDTTIPALVATQVERTPSAPAVITGDTVLTYQELHSRALALASHLHLIGVTRGTVVALFLPRSPELMVALLATLYAGATYLPLDPTYPTERIAYMVADSGATWAISDRTHQSNLPTTIQVVNVDGALDRTPAGLPVVEPTDIAYLLYTSGSTGQPKGVTISHRALLNHALAQAENYELGVTDRVLQFASISFDVAGEEIYPTWVRGGAVVLRDDSVLAGVEAFHDFITRHHITVLNPPTAFWQDWVAGLVTNPLLIPPTVRLVIVGGEGSATERLRHWWELAGREIRWLNAYGPTETTITATLYEPPHLPASAIVPIGRPLANMSAYVLDEALQWVPPGVVGDLYLGGLGLAEGYHNRPVLTTEQFITTAPEGLPERLYRTGDRARLLADGVLEFAGRNDDQIKLRGFRIEPGEIEASLLRHPAIQGAAITVQDKDTALPFLAAYWVVHSGHHLTVGEIRTYLATHLPAYMLPATHTVLAEMPLTPSGKINRRALPTPDLTPTAETTTPDAVMNSPLVELITGVWETLLEHPTIHPHANFFEVGGHSLLATRVVARLRTMLNRDIPLRLLFEQPTIAGLAEHLEQSTNESGLPPLELNTTEHIHPLSFAQERLWFLEQYDPNTATYNIPASLVLRGTLDSARLEQALNGVVERHESLRTTFGVESGQPMQVVLPPAFIPLPVLTPPPIRDSQAALGSEVVKADWEAESRRFARQPFALEQELPVRWELLAIAADEHWLLLSFHHAMMDGWSVALFTRELVALYQGEALPPVPIRYGDYARWQRNWSAASNGLERERTYWQQQLHELPVLETATDVPRPAHQSTNGVQTRWQLPAALMEQVERFSRTVGVTPFMTLLAAYYTLLYRYTGQSDLPVGTPVAGRLHPATESVLGLFVNTLVLRGDLSGVAHFRALVERVRGMTLEAFSHQALPFEQVVSAVAPDRSLHHTPLFQTMFVWQGDAGVLPVTEGLQLETLDVDTGVARVELTWILSKANGALRGLVEYNCDLFAPDTIARMTGHFQTLLTHALAEPTLPLHDLPLISETEAATLQRWSKSPVRNLSPLTVAERFEQHVAQMPHATAVLTTTETLTYDELNRRANRLARVLRQQGIQQESVVGIALPRTAEMVVALLAIMKAGGAYLPLDPAYPAERLRYMVDTAMPVLLITSYESATHFPVADVPTLTLDTLNLSEGDDSNLAVAGSVDHLAYIMFTSGSTGQPKGIAIPQRGILRLAQEQQFFSFKGETWMFLAPLGFDASTLELWGPLLGGGQVALYPDELPSPEGIATAIEQFGVTGMWLTAGLFHQMVEQHVAGLAPLRQLVAGGDVLSVAAVQKVRHAFPHLRLTNGYGPTENTTFTTCYSIPESPVFHHAVPIGYPIDHTDTVILDARLRRVPIGVAGDLYTGGDGLARGYVRSPAFTAERFIPHPFSDTPGARLYCTGDRARYLLDGAIEFLGRNDSQVKVRGFRIELGEIEMVLGSHPAVENAVATVRVAPSATQVLVAYVVGDVTAAEIRAFLQESLPDYMVPSLIVVVATLPLTPNGKVDRRALPEPSFTDTDNGATAPVTETEKRMAALWEELLGVPINRESHFFYMGGHSLLATGIVARVRQMWNIALPLKTLFEHPTLAAWADVVDRTVQAREASHPKQTYPVIRQTWGDNTTPIPLSFAQERLWFLDQLSPGDAALNIPVALNLYGALDVARLETALAQIVVRHSVLRTTFTLIKGQPVQVVNDTLTIPLEVVDGKTSVLEHRGAVESFIEQPFDLATGPLVRWRLIRMAEEHHLLVVLFHHSISDGWSVGKFMREVEQGYQGMPLPPLPIQYGDYAWWQREWLASATAEQELAYWRIQLTPLPPVLDLPTDYPRPAVLSTRGAEQVAWIPTEMTQALRELAQAENTTLFMVLCAAFKVLLARLSGQSDIAVGTPIAGRTQPEVEPLLGIFLNTLVLRSDLAQTATFRDILAQVRTIALNGYEHQLIPFEKLLEAFVPERSLSHAPLFQAFFNMLTLEEGLLNLPDIRSERYPLRDQHSKFDLTLYAQERNGKIRLTFVYSTDLFNRERMAAMAAQYGALLGQVVSAPEQAWEGYSLLPDAHRAILPDPSVALDDRWHGTVYQYLAKWGHQPAIQGADGTVQTYAEVAAESDAITKRLHYVGVSPQQVVAIFAARHPALVSTVVGILKAGATFTMLDPAYPPARLLHYLEIAKPAAFVQMPGADALPAEVRSWMAERQVPVLPLPLRYQANGNGFHATPRQAIDLSANSRAVLTFTSGSTGVPKGIWGRHGPLTHFYPDMATRFGLNGNDRFAMLSGLAHDPLQRDIFTPLWVGASLAVPDGARLGEPGYLAQWLAEQAVTVVHLTPAMGQLIVEFAGKESLPALRLAFFVGDKLTWRDVERLRAVAPNIQVVNLYGSTETQRAVSYYRIDHSADAQSSQKQIIPIGAGFPDVQLLILNGVGNQAGVGELGEIYLRSPHLAEGYHDPALTEIRFLPNPFTQEPTDRLYRTGDLGRYRPDGQVEGAGRNDRQVKIRGFRIELGEIEAALLRHAGVRQAVVVRHTTTATEQLVAYLVPTGTETPSSADLRTHLGQGLPEYMLPTLFIPIPRVPLTPNGKLDERALPNPTDYLTAPIEVEAAPRNEVEKWLVTLWRELLNRDTVSVTANFFALGGHSLLATRLISRINDHYEMTVPLRAFFEKPTIADLADLIETTILAEISAMDEAAIRAALES